MSITPQSASEANHPDAIRHELDWLLHAKPFWRSTNRLTIPWLSLAESLDTESIATFLASQWAWHGEPRRLGRRFEELLTAIIDECSTLHLLKHGLPIRIGSQTIGELDYLIRHEEQVIHIEVAIKFYAGMPGNRDRTQPINWVGPSCQDRLDLKMNHLIAHQLPLSQSAEAMQILAELDIPQPRYRLGLIYGYLLHPWQEPIVMPMGTEHGNRAYWCSHRDYTAAFRAVSRPTGSDCGWCFIPRDQWIGPADRQPELPLIPRTLHRPEQADCYALVRKKPPHTEELRLYVMPDDFEQKALDASNDTN